MFYLDQSKIVLVSLLECFFSGYLLAQTEGGHRISPLEEGEERPHYSLHLPKRRL